MPNTHELISEYERLRAETRREVAELQEDTRTFQSTLAVLPTRQEELRFALASWYLQELSEEGLANAAQWTGFGGFRRMEPLKAMERELSRLAQEEANILAEDRYLRRDELVGSQGQLTRQIHWAQDEFARWDEPCHRFEALPGFLELMEKNYDTPDFSLRWWSPHYWHLWARGDAICQALGMKDFGDEVRPAYLQVRKPRDAAQETLGQLMAQRDEIKGLARRLTAIRERRQNLPAIYLQECRQALAHHLQTAELGLLDEWAQGLPEVQQLLRQLATAQAKDAAIRQLAERTTRRANQFALRESLYERKIQKLSRPKYAGKRWLSSELPSKGFSSVTKSRLDRQRMRESHQRIHDYEVDERLDLSLPQALWWYEFTRTRPPAGMAWREWYDQHPDFAQRFPGNPTHDASEEVLLAAATSRAHDPLGDLS